MARRRPKYLLERTREGYVLHLDQEERDLVVRLIGEMRDLVLSDDPQHQPLVRRLFPPAYHLAEHAEQEAEFQKYMHEELVASRLESMGVVESALTSGAPMDDGQVIAFVQSLNAVRLVLGTILDVSEEHDPNDVRDDDPMVGEHHLYTFLSWLLEHAMIGLSRQGT